MWKSDVVVAESGKTKAEDIKLASATIITSNTTSKSVTATTLFDKTQLDTVLSKIDSYYFGKIKEVSGVDKSLRGTKGFFNSDETIPPLFLMKLAGSLVESLKNASLQSK